MTDTIRLSVEGAGHAASTVKLYINDHDTGVLYLNPDELNILNNVITSGAIENNVKIETTSPDDDEIDFDIFDELE